MKKNRYIDFLGKICKTALVLGLSIIFSIVLDETGFRVENILMIYVIGVLVVILETKSFLWGTISAFICVLAFNYFFTDPRYTFMVDDPNHYFSFIIFILVAFIVSTLTSRLQKQIKIAKENEKITNKLYKISSGYLNITGFENITSYGQKSLEYLIDRKCIIHINQDYKHHTILKWCFENSMICGYGESYFNKEKNKFYPIKSNRQTLGVLEIDFTKGNISEEEKLCIDALLSQIIIALEREILSTSEEINRLNIEKEKLRNNLLRSISHDLRTPLTAISGGANFLAESIETLDLDTVKSLLNDISCDSSWLSSLVDNLLNMTRIQDGKLLINIKNEVVDDIIAESISRIIKRSGNHKIMTLKPQDVILVPMDGQLIIQVIVNLLDNAIKHTKDDSEILLSAYSIDSNIIFEVSDNGGGINSEIIDTIFENYVSNDDSQRGIGIGLSICQSIIHAHLGEIIAENNNNGGATFKFKLPLEVQ